LLPAYLHLLALWLTVCSVGPEQGRSDCCCEPGDGDIKVSVVAILATGQNDKVDEKLECIAREIKKKDPTLTGFTMARATCRGMAAGGTSQFPLVEGRVADVLLRHGCDEDGRVSLRVKAPELGDIEYTSACGKFFPIITPYVTRDGDRLIVAVMVKPCKKTEESKEPPSR
jgi:hypothetical protein